MKSELENAFSIRIWKKGYYFRYFDDLQEEDVYLSKTQRCVKEIECAINRLFILDKTD